MVSEKNAKAIMNQKLRIELRQETCNSEKTTWISWIGSASEMTYTVSGGALNSTHSLLDRLCNVKKDFENLINRQNKKYSSKRKKNKQHGQCNIDSVLTAGVSFKFRYAPDYCTNRGFWGLANLSVVSEICLRPTPVAMATKI